MYAGTPLGMKRTIQIRNTLRAQREKEKERAERERLRDERVKSALEIALAQKGNNGSLILNTADRDLSTVFEIVRSPFLLEAAQASRGIVKPLGYLSGRTSLMYAAMTGNKERTLELIEAGGHVEVKDRAGRNALHWACIGKNGIYTDTQGEVLEMLLHPPGRKNYMKIQIKNRPAGSALIDGVKVIEEIDEYGFTPLQYACIYGNSNLNKGTRNLELVSILVKNGAKVDNGRLKPLIIASQNNNIEIVKYLLDKGANIEAKQPHNSYTALIAACERSSPEVVSLLLDAGANVDAIERNRLKCIHVAALYGNNDIIRILAENKGTNILNERAGMDNVTPLHLLVLNKRENDPIETVRVLLEEGADPNIGRASDNSITPLVSACVNMLSPQLIDLLVQAGANPDIPNEDGMTARSIVFNKIYELDDGSWPEWYTAVQEIFARVPIQDNATSPQEGGRKFKNRTKKRKRVCRRVSKSL